MTHTEARAVLGLAENATPAEIRAAWKRLLKACHPDSGGTAYLAQSINAAKETLLGERRADPDRQSQPRTGATGAQQETWEDVKPTPQEPSPAPQHFPWWDDFRVWTGAIMACGVVVAIVLTPNPKYRICQAEAEAAAAARGNAEAEARLERCVAEWMRRSQAAPQGGVEERDWTQQVPGIMLENVGPRAPPVPPKAAPQPPPQRVTIGQPPPPAVNTWGAGYVAVLSSQKSRTDALKAFSDLQQKYGEALSGRTPDVQEVNLGENGIWYRAVVGPPGSRDAANGICSQLKAAGYPSCWVTAY